VIHKSKKIRSLGLEPDQFCFIDLQYHLGRSTHKRDITDVISDLEKTADILAITSRGNSLEPNELEYSFDQLICEVQCTMEWKVTQLSPDAALLSCDDRKLIIINNQETMTYEGVELITFGNRKFKKLQSTESIINESDFTILSHPYAHPCKYLLNVKAIDRIRPFLWEISAFETYNQSTQLIYFGQSNKLSQLLAQNYKKPGVVSSDSHNYVARNLHNSGMVVRSDLFNQKDGNRINKKGD
jgi:hypothetical protein